MGKTLLSVTAAGLVLAGFLAGGATVSRAEEATSAVIHHRQGVGAGNPGILSRTANPGAMGPGMMGPGMMGPGMMGPGMMGPGMMGPGMMGPGMMGPGMMTMMMVMMDVNGDGALSMEELQAVHTRMFNYADTDKDGKLTPDEMRGVMHGGPMRSDN